MRHSIKYLAAGAGVLVLIAAWCTRTRSEGPTDMAVYVGMADASAAIAIDESRFVVADDEDNVLRAFDRREPGEPVAAFDLTPYLNLERKSPEVDLEAATRLGDRVYWLSSHGTNKNGRQRLNRRRFFATEFKVDGDEIKMQFVGKPYAHLVEDLVAAPQLAKYNLAAKAKLAPKAKGGLNIEGLATTPSGEMLIGLRSPLHEGRAILIPLTNPAQVIEGERALFGSPIELELGRLGIRGIGYAQDRGRYVILAGPQATGTSRIYTWSGNPTDRAEPLSEVDLRGWNPEACITDKLDRVQLLSDDGVKTGEELPRTFRSGWVGLARDPNS